MSSSHEGVYEPGVVDPGVPNPTPTQSFWQSELHALSHHQSAWPASTVDVAIIGSGITGTNLARNLVRQDPALSIVVLEARTLCSGATGRNGGHIKTMAFAVWEDRVRTYGVDEAIKLTEFEHSHLQAKTSAAASEGIDCDIVMTEGIDAYFDQVTWDQARHALEAMRVHAPHLARLYTVYTDRTYLSEVLNLSQRCVGAIGVPAASLWPYKFVTGLMAKLVESGKVNLQTQTVVKSIADDDYADAAVLHTNRGALRARKVVHATNGWLGHLIPELRDFVSPVRGNVVHLASQASTVAASALGFDQKYSYWLRYSEKDYDYLIQREGGDVVVGRANTGRRATGDDSATDLQPMAHLRGFGYEVARSPTTNAADSVDQSWSGILAFTEDSSPFVGRLPFTGRSHQWVCGGYHGIGMTKAFRSAEMLTFLMLGIEPPSDYPRSMLLTPGRLRTLERSVEADMGKSRSKL